MLGCFEKTIFRDFFILEPFGFDTKIAFRFETVHKYLEEFLLVVWEVIFCFTVVEIKELSNYLAKLQFLKVDLAQCF